jgi:hypothetical protein
VAREQVVDQLAHIAPAVAVRQHDESFFAHDLAAASTSCP